MPLNWLPPPLVTIDTVPPPVRPYWASYVLVRTLNSWIVSIVGTWTTSREGRTFEMPSTRISFSLLTPPLTEKFEVPPVSNERRKRQSPVLMTPAAAHANWNGLRPWVGTSSISLLAITWERDAVSVSSIETDSETVTLSLTSPMVRATSTRARSWVWSTMFSRTYCLKPANCTVSR